MAPEIPVACSLSADDLTARLAQTAALGRDALVDARIDATHASLTFAPGAGVRRRVDAFVAAETACCPFFSMDVSDAPEAVVLTIDAPEDAEPLLRELVAAFGPE